MRSKLLLHFHWLKESRQVRESAFSWLYKLLHYTCSHGGWQRELRAGGARCDEGDTSRSPLRDPPESVSREGVMVRAAFYSPMPGRSDEQSRTLRPGTSP